MKKIHIVILPNEKLLQKAHEVSAFITSEVESFFTLNSTKAQGHITLSQIETEENDEARIIEEIKKIAESTQHFKASLTGTGSLAGWTWITTSFGEIQTLHEKVVSIAPPGKSTTAKPYLPHLTILRTRDHSEAHLKKTEKSLKEYWGKLPESFNVDKIAIGYAGEHGVFETHVHTFDLGK